MEIFQGKAAAAGAGVGAASPSPSSVGAEGVIFDVTVTNFEQDVLQASLRQPVIVDFWAPWCGPCRQLLPLLETAVLQARGAVRLCKINIDQSPELAQAMRVQSVPTVYAFFQGQPVDGFMGAQPESQVQQFVARLAKLAGGAAPAEGSAPDIAALLQDAEKSFQEGRLDDADAALSRILDIDEEHVPARALLAHCYLARGEHEAAAALLEGFSSEDLSANSHASQVSSALQALAQAASMDSAEITTLKDRIGKNPRDHQARIDLAAALYAHNDAEAAADCLLESIALDKGWEDGLARQKLLQMLESLGPAHPVSVSSRRRLSSILFA